MAGKAVIGKLFADLGSQPARAVYWFCVANELPVELVLTRIAKGEHLTPSFKEVNPLGKIPAYAESDGFALSESYEAQSSHAAQDPHSNGPFARLCCAGAPS